MKCPICGGELKRSTKNPEYGLCYNCRKKIKWKEEPRRRKIPEYDYYEEEEEEEKTERFKTFRLVIGIISIVLFLFIVLQSCAAGVANTLSESGEVSGSAGFILAVFMIVAGIVTICMRKRESIPAFAVPGGFYLAGALLGGASVGSYGDLAIWAVMCGAFSALHFLFMMICKDKLVIGIIIAVLIVAVISGISMASSKDSASEKTAAKEETKSEKEDDGIIDFDGTGFNIKLTKTETGTDYEGNPCIYVYYTFTNNGEETISPATSAHVQVFQNGVEQEIAIITDSCAEIDNYLNDVQTGATSDVCEVFGIQDNSDVTIEVSDFISMDGSKDTQVITLQ